MGGQDGTRARLIAAGVDIVDAKGFEAIGVRAVAARAGVSHGAPRRYFPTLENLLAAIAAEGVRDLNARLEPAMSRSVAEGAVEYWRFARSRPGMFALIFRHDLLDSAGGNLRDTTGSWFADLVAQVGDEVAAISSWAAVHGLCVLHASGAPSAVGVTVTEDLVRQVVAQHGAATSGYRRTAESRAAARSALRSSTSSKPTEKRR